MQTNTDYTEDLKELILKMYEPSSPEDSSSIAMTISHLHEEVTNILSAKWVYQEDVYEVLKALGYKTYHQKTETKYTEQGKEKSNLHYSLKYFVKIK